MYMDNIKLFNMNDKEEETLILAVMVSSYGIRNEICASKIMKNGKRQMTEGIRLPNQEKIGTLDEKETNNDNNNNNNKYCYYYYYHLGVFGADII